MLIPNIGQTVLVLRDGHWDFDWVLQKRIETKDKNHPELGVLVWGFSKERFKPGQFEWKEM